MSPPRPCSPSNLSLKTYFLPFIIVLLTSAAAASRGLAWLKLESCDLLPGRRKGKCVSEARSRTSREVRGQLNSDPISSSRTKDPTHFYSVLLPLLSITLSFLSSTLSGLCSDHKSLWLRAIIDAKMWLIKLNITRISGASPQQGPELDMDRLRNQHNSLCSPLRKSKRTGSACLPSVKSEKDKSTLVNSLPKFLQCGTNKGLLIHLDNIGHVYRLKASLFSYCCTYKK